ncbi:MAG: DUF4235 domain-containing protein [Propioniciclava sp.]
MEISQKLVWNLYSTTIATLSGIVASKAVDAAWGFVTGAEPPEPNDPDTPTSVAVIRVAAVALGVGLSQVLVNRMAARHWQQRTGLTTPIRSVNVKL